MKRMSRRGFLHQLGAAATTVGLARAAFSSSRIPQHGGERPFEMLVVGDSHISGQGLLRENKTYYLVKEWLEREFFQDSRAVNLVVKAHSGSRIDLHPEELERMIRAGDNVNKS